MSNERGAGRRIHAFWVTTGARHVSYPRSCPLSLAGQAGGSGLAHLAAVGGECPDDEHVDRDDDEGPQRVGRDEREVGDQADRGGDDADGAGQEVAAEHPDAGEHHDEPDDEMDPAPLGDVEVERGAVGPHDPFVVHNGGRHGARGTTIA